MGKKAEAGIGSLILFIALVLVAATAAAVFIETSSSLQGKALTTAANSQKAVATRVQIISAWGENASDVANIGDIYMKIKLAPGSDAVPINNSYVSAATNDQRVSYRFNQSSSCTPANLANVANADKFLVTGRIGYAKVGYIQEGDIIDVCFRLPTNLTADEPLTASFTPTTGTPTSFSTTTPSILVDAKVPLYP